MIQTKKPKSKTTAVVLAVLFSYWTWAYTWNKDKGKWLAGMLLCLFLFWTLLVPIGVMIWAITDSVGKPKEWYEKYVVIYK